jgi:hypothetical protein
MPRKKNLPTLDRGTSLAVPEELTPEEVFKAALIGATIAAFQPGSSLHQNSRKDRLMETYVENVLSFSHLLSQRAAQLLKQPLAPHRLPEEEEEDLPESA